MHHLRTLLFTFLLTLVGLASVKADDHPSGVFVSTTWLAEHMNDPSLVILNVAQNRRDYLKGHVPGARFLWVGWMASSNPDLSFQLLPTQQIDSLLEELGVSNDSKIVLCGVNGNVSPTARIFATLEYMGMGGRTWILDGGFDAWKAENRPIEKETPSFARAKFTPHLKTDAIVDWQYVNSNLDKPGVAIVDARADQFYNGIGGGFPRTGRIPGSKNLYFATLVDSSNRMLPVDSIKTLFSKAGVSPGDEIITYCHIGQTASLVYATARHLGYKAHLYDGSFEDWSGREDLPVFMPAKKDSTK